MTFLERVKSGIVVFDGAMGTMLQKHMTPGQLPETLNMTMPEVITGVHKAYIDAGCDVVETNTLNANRIKVEKAGYKVRDIVSAAVQNAKRAIAECGHEAFVAMSVGSTGIMLKPLGDMEFDTAVDIYSEMVTAGEKAGADLILIETVSDLYEIKAAVAAAKRCTKLPVAVTLTFFSNGRLLTGADVRTSVAALESFGVDIIGMNCGLGPVQMLGLIDDMYKCSSLPILINPNAGLPTLVNGESVYSVHPDDFASECAHIVESGARLIGGCCGTTPEHIKKLSEMVRELAPSDIMKSREKIITSGSKSVRLTDKIEVEHIADTDIDDIVDSSLDSEADVIALGCDNLTEAIYAVQEVCLKPICLISDDIEAIRDAAFHYNGKPLIGMKNGGDLMAFIKTAKELGAVLMVKNAEEYSLASSVLDERNVYLSC